MQKSLEDKIWKQLELYVKDGTLPRLQISEIEISHLSNPVFVFCGKGLNSSVDTTLAEFILEFQENILRSYSILKYNTTDTRKLQNLKETNLKYISKLSLTPPN